MQENNNLWEQILELRIQKKTASQDRILESRMQNSLTVEVILLKKLVMLNEYWNWQCQGTNNLQQWILELRMQKLYTQDDDDDDGGGGGNKVQQLQYCLQM